MKIAITSTGPGLDDTVETRFGRCAYFVIIDPDTLEFESIQNPNIAAGGGAGIQSAQLMADKDVSTMLTGNCGPNAFRTFGAAEIQVITGVSGQVREAIQKYKSGQLDSASAPNVQSHFGTGGGKGMGRGMGMGGGGGGGGGGMGRTIGNAQPVNAGPNTAPSKAVTKKDEVEVLKEQARTLQDQMDQIVDRIKKVEKAKEE